MASQNFDKSLQLAFVALAMNLFLIIKWLEKAINNMGKVAIKAM